MSEAAPAAAAPAVRTRPFFWSVRRELWEHRSIVVAPLAFAAVVLFGFLISTFRFVHTSGFAGRGEHKVDIAQLPYIFAAVAVLATGLATALLYSLSALHNERRDRSILFWKSLPVSDLTTVLSKAAVPIIVVPPVLFVIILVTHIVMAAIGAVAVLANGLDLSVYFAHTHLPSMWLMLLKGLPFIALWYAPLYGWLMLVSVWARRAPFLWATLPPIAIGLVERIAFGTHYVFEWIGVRLTGAFSGGSAAMSRSFDLAPLTSPHLWTGLILAAALFALTIRLRRSRDPI